MKIESAQKFSDNCCGLCSGLRSTDSEHREATAGTVIRLRDVYVQRYFCDANARSYGVSACRLNIPARAPRWSLPVSDPMAVERGAGLRRRPLHVTVPRSPVRPPVRSRRRPVAGCSDAIGWLVLSRSYNRRPQAAAPSASRHRLDVPPRRLCPRLFRQMPDQLPHIGERDRIHDRWDCQWSGQGAGPVLGRLFGFPGD